MRPANVQTPARRILAATRVLSRFTAGNAAPGKVAEAYLPMARRLETLLWNSGVYGYAIAEKRSGGRPTGQISIRFYVAEKVGRRRLKQPWRIPPELTIGSGEQELRIATDVVELKQIPTAQRLVRAGDSLAHFRGPTGTLGLVVVDGQGERFLLTCAHVARPALAAEGDSIESPSDTDGLAGGNVIGTLHKWTEFSVSSHNTMDAALVKPGAGELDFTNAALGLGANAGFADLLPSQYLNLRNEAISRHGQFGTRSGVIDSVENDLPIQFGARTFRFTEAVRYESVSRSGESGAAIVHPKSGRVVGMHFAGDGTHGYFITSRKLKRTFGIEVASQ